MTFNLPEDLGISIEAAVQSGRFASVDEAMAEAARMLLRDVARKPRLTTTQDGADESLGIIGVFRDDPESIDQVVEHAMKAREARWRPLTGE